jgi:hypothetical protein
MVKLLPNSVILVFEIIMEFECRQQKDPEADFRILFVSFI